MATLVSVSQQAWDDQWDDDTESPWVTAPKQMKSPGAGGTVTDLQFRPKSNKTVHQRNTDKQIFLFLPFQNNMR